MALVCKYVALFVPDLRAAEEFYETVFGMESLFREAEVGGVWRALPADRGWDDAAAAGIELGMAALRRDEFVLALFQGAPTAGTVLEICLGLPGEEIEAVRERLPGVVTLLEHEEGFLHFDDPFGFRWTLQEPDVPFLSAGHDGRWLEL